MKTLRTAALAALTLAAPPLSAQIDTTTDECYRFDRRYFSWVGRAPGGGAVFVDSNAVIKLASAAHPGGPFRNRPGARVLVPPAMNVDSLSVRRWLGPSHWRILAPDSVEIVWRNGLYGPVFRMRVSGDTLEGRVRFTTDVRGGEPPPQPAMALRVPCPMRDGTPSNKRLLQAGAYVLRELTFVRLSAHVRRTDDGLASGRVARSRSAER
jgi:hypothetical protein